MSIPFENESGQNLLEHIDSVLLNGPQLLLGKVYDEIEFSAIRDTILRELVISRICHPASKLSTKEFIRRHFGDDISEDRIYRYMDKLYNTQKEIAQRISVEHTVKVLGDAACLLFYDVTTLYFESSIRDGLRENGFHEKLCDDGKRLIIGYSSRRARNDRYNREKGLKRLRNAFASGRFTKENINKRGYDKFLEPDGRIGVRISEDKIEEDARWDGLKGYVTNTSLSAQDVVEQYHGLWVVERASRVTKGNFEMRPIFHFTPRRIEAHICICFIALKVYKEWERRSKACACPLSVDTVLTIANTITTIYVRNNNGALISKRFF